MNVDFFLDRVFKGFRTHVAATTVCTTGSVHTLTCRTHFCTYTHGSSVMSKRCLLHVCHLSLLFLHGHFETTPDHDFTDSDIHNFLPYFPVLKAQDTRNSAHASRSLATWPSQLQAHSHQTDTTHTVVGPNCSIGREIQPSRRRLCAVHPRLRGRRSR